MKGQIHSLRITSGKSAASLLKSREQRYVKVINNNLSNYWGCGASSAVYFAHIEIDYDWCQSETANLTGVYLCPVFP